MRASQFITEAMDTDAVNELDSFIMNDEDLYRRRFMPIISNIKRKLKKNVYDHEKAQKLLIDSFGIEKLFSVIGGSMGGMLVLEWLSKFPSYVFSAIPIATTTNHSAE